MDVISLYYYEYENYFVGDDGEIIYDIFRYISPSKLMLFKLKRGTYYIYPEDLKDTVYELVFPLDEEDYDE